MTRLFVFADESGNFDFQPHESQRNGPSRYFAVGTALLQGEDAVDKLSRDLQRLRRDLAWKGVGNAQSFHASTDTQVVRDAVFQLLVQHPIRYDVTILEKAKAQPQTRINNPTFYKYAWYYHFRTLARREIRHGDELMVVAASIGTKKLRAAFRGAVESVVQQCAPHVRREVLTADMACDPCLQAADYGLWAVMRDWEQGDPRALEQCRPLVRSQFDLFATGRTYYYGPNSSKASAS